MKAEVFDGIAENHFRNFLQDLHKLNAPGGKGASLEGEIRKIFPHLAVQSPVYKVTLDLSDPGENPDRGAHLYLEFNRETDEVVRAHYVYRDGEHRKEFDVFTTGELDPLARYALGEES